MTEQDLAEMLRDDAAQLSSLAKLRGSVPDDIIKAGWRLLSHSMISGTDHVHWLFCRNEDPETYSVAIATSDREALNIVRDLCGLPRI